MKKYNIVILENDEDELFFMNEAFKCADLFNVMAQFESGDELMEWLDNHMASLPDLILSDLNMPGKNGFDIIEGVTHNSLLAHIPVVITSTSSTRTIIDKCIAFGAAEYVIKPSSFLEYPAFTRNLHQLLTLKSVPKNL